MALTGTTVLTTIVALFAWQLMRFVLTFFTQWYKLRKIPTVPSPSIFWGQARTWSKPSLPIHLAEWAAKYGSVYKLRFLNRWAVIVTDPALVRAVLQNSKTYVPKSREIYHAMETGSEPRLKNILSSFDDEYWRAVRGAWMKCFTSPNLKQILPVVNELCTKVSQQLTAAAAASPDGVATVKINELTDRITLDAVGHVSYGKDFGAVDSKRNRYLHLVNAQLQFMHQDTDPTLMQLAEKVFRNRQKVALRAEWNQVNTAEVQAAMDNPPGPNTIIGQLLQVSDPATGKPLTLDQLKAEMVIAALAGFETTSMGLTWTLGALACHPEVLRELESELAGFGLLVTAESPEPKPFSWQMLGKLSYLQAVIREGLRLFSPAATGSFRMSAVKDIQLREGLVIPKDTAVGVPLFAFGHSPHIYGPDVEEFRPSRWLAGSSRTSSAGDVRGADGALATEPAGADPMASTDSAVAAVGGSSSSSKLQDPWTFSIGPRDCAGQALARLELQAVIAMLVGRFEIELAPEVGGWEGLLARRMYHITLQVEGGLPMRFRPRAVV